MAKKKSAVVEPGPSCRDCRHFVPYYYEGTDQGWGECKRYPPTIMMMSSDEGDEPLTLYPQVEPSDVCGELALKN